MRTRTYESVWSISRKKSWKLWTWNKTCSPSDSRQSLVPIGIQLQKRNKHWLTRSKTSERSFSMWTTKRMDESWFRSSDWTSRDSRNSCSLSTRRLHQWGSSIRGRMLWRLITLMQPWMMRMTDFQVTQASNSSSICSETMTPSSKVNIIFLTNQSRRWLRSRPLTRSHRLSIGSRY